MANCTLNKDLLRGDTCNYSLPEVKDIYIANYASVTASTVSSDCTSGIQLTDIQMASTADTFYHIEPAKNSVSFTDELVVEDNGNKYRTHTITFTISGKYDKDMVCPIDALSLGRFFVVVATADGEYLALGRTAGMEASAQSVAGGGDSNGITVTLTANVTETAVPLSDTAIAKVKGA